MTAPGEPVVIIFATIMSGTVVRWYPSLADAERADSVLSASRDGVMIHGDVFLHQLPSAWLEAAQAAHEALRKDDRDAVRHLATHRLPFGTTHPEPVPG